MSVKSFTLKIAGAGILLAGLWGCNSSTGVSADAEFATYKGKLKESMFEQDTTVVDSCKLAIEGILDSTYYPEFGCYGDSTITDGFGCEQDSVRARLNASLKASCKYTSGKADTAYVITYLEGPEDEQDWVYATVDKELYIDDEETDLIGKYPYKAKISTTIERSSSNAFIIKAPNLKESSIVLATCNPRDDDPFLMDTYEDEDTKEITVSPLELFGTCEVGDIYEITVEND